MEKALVGAFYVIVKTDCETDGSFYSTTCHIAAALVTDKRTFATLWRPADAVFTRVLMFWSEVPVHADCVYCGCRSHNWKYIPVPLYMKISPSIPDIGCWSRRHWPGFVIVMRTVKTSPAFVSAMFGASSAVNTSSQHLSHLTYKW